MFNLSEKGIAPKPPRVTYSVQAKAYNTSNNSSQHSIGVTSK